jgi:hypothetical protein
LLGHRQFVRPLILGPRRWQHDQASIKVNLTPTKSTDFIPSLPCQHQQADDVTELILAQGFQDRTQFLIG